MFFMEKNTALWLKMTAVLWRHNIPFRGRSLQSGVTTWAFLPPFPHAWGSRAEGMPLPFLSSLPSGALPGPVITGGPRGYTAAGTILGNLNKAFSATSNFPVIIKLWFNNIQKFTEPFRRDRVRCKSHLLRIIIIIIIINILSKFTQDICQKGKLLTAMQQ